MRYFSIPIIVAALTLSSFASGRAIYIDAPESVPFDQFQVSTEVESMEFEIRGTFKLGGTSDGVNFFTEPVVIKVGDFTANIAPGSFTQEERGKIRFKGKFEETNLDVKIRVLANNAFEVKIEGEGTRPLGKIEPATVGLWIGNDGSIAARR